MNGADGFDVGLGLLRKRTAQLVVVALVLLTGGRFVDWYVNEKVASAQEMMQDFVGTLMTNLATPTPTLAR